MGTLAIAFELQTLNNLLLLIQRNNTRTKKIVRNASENVGRIYCGFSFLHNGILGRINKDAELQNSSQKLLVNRQWFRAFELSVGILRNTNNNNDPRRNFTFNCINQNMHTT